jgi:hypothetical protein
MGCDAEMATVSTLLYFDRSNSLRHCEFLSVDRLDHLIRSTKEDIMMFLEWMLDEYKRIKKRSSLHEYWRIWCMLYRKSVGTSIHAQVREEVNDVSPREGSHGTES